MADARVVGKRASVSGDEGKKPDQKTPWKWYWTHIHAKREQTSTNDALDGRKDACFEKYKLEGRKMHVWKNTNRSQEKCMFGKIHIGGKKMHVWKTRLQMDAREGSEI